MTRLEAREVVKNFYHDENNAPIILTDSQCDVFVEIFTKAHPRVQVMGYTRFGKSLTIALAVLTRITSHSEKWAIVAGSEAKAGIIMGYIIQHAFDNEFTKSKLELGGESLERLKRERSKSRLTFKQSNGTQSEVFVLSGDSRNKAKAGEALMGFGAPNIIGDEMALIDDDIEAKIFRMLGDQTNNFYCKVGNPFRRNHFLKSYRDPSYHKIEVDYQIGLKEGRITQAFIDEARKKPFFGVHYENKFPDAEAIDDKGWSYLITDRELENALATIEPEAEFGVKMLGHDVARGGGCFNVWVLRRQNYARLLGKNQDADLMSTTGTTIRLVGENKIDWENVSIDDTGIGGGETDRLREQRYFPNAVVNGAVADDQDKFKNRRAENYWKLKQWLNGGGKLCATDNWGELLDLKYKSDSSGKLQIMSKDDMRCMGIDSPDVADALSETFDRHAFVKESKIRYNGSEESFDPHAAL